MKKQDAQSKTRLLAFFAAQASSAQNPAGQSPTQTLKAFHQNITDKAYRKAYDCLSRDCFLQLPLFA